MSDPRLRRWQSWQNSELWRFSAGEAHTAEVIDRCEIPTAPTLTQDSTEKTWKNLIPILVFRNNLQILTKDQVVLLALLDGNDWKNQ